MNVGQDARSFASFQLSPRLMTMPSYWDKKRMSGMIKYNLRQNYKSTAELEEFKTLNMLEHIFHAIWGQANAARRYVYY